VVELGFWFFGVWTVGYHLACWTHTLSTTPLLLGALLATAALAPWIWRRHRLAGADDAVVCRPRLVVALFWVAVACFVVAAAALGSDRAERYPLGWGLMAAGLAPLVVAVVLQPRGPRAGLSRPDTSVSAWLGSAAAVLAGLGLGIVSLFLRNVSFDDVFYVNKAVYVAERGVIPLRDTVYSDQVLPALRGAGTVPIQSIEVLQGAVAHILGFSGGTAAYIVTPLVMAFVAVWVTWWLVRSWSRGPAVVAFLCTMAYLVWGMNRAPGADGSTAFSSIFIRSIWQGKVIFLCAALPFVYLVVTRWLRERRMADLLLMVLVGAVGVGLTSSAVFLLPPLAVGLAAAMAACRQKAFVGPLLMSVYPIGAGLVVSAQSEAEPFGAILRTADEAFYNVIGHGGWGILGMAALVVAPWCARPGAARTVAAGGAVAAVIAVAPFMPSLMNELTGAGPVLWRLTWLAPLPVLVGLLATGPWDNALLTKNAIPRPAVGALRVLPPVALGVTIVSIGALIWVPGGPAPLTDRPTWKFPERALERAAHIRDLYPGTGTVLAPREVMSAIALTTSRFNAVDPRAFFLQSLDEPALMHNSRTILSRTMASVPPRVPRTWSTHLDLLHVNLVCLDDAQPTYREAMRALHWSEKPAGRAFACYQRPSA
jgi:hypothetical protein